jgi:hypothetical protein
MSLVVTVDCAWVWVMAVYQLYVILHVVRNSKGGRSWL